jgi:hypothetical protein
VARCDSYPAGECTSYVCQQLSFVGDSWGNATDWLNSGIAAGFNHGSQPYPCAIVVYAQGDGYSAYGHVAIVRAVYAPDQFLVTEMNFVEHGVVNSRVSNMYDVEGFVLPPAGFSCEGGGDPGGGGTGPAELAGAWASFADALNNYWPDRIREIAGYNAQLDNLTH